MFFTLYFSKSTLILIYQIKSGVWNQYFRYLYTCFSLVIFKYGCNNSWQSQSAAIECMNKPGLFVSFFFKPAFQPVSLK